MEQSVICQGNSLLVDFAITIIVDAFIFWLQVQVLPWNMWFHNPQVLTEALLSLTKVPLMIQRKRRSCNIFQISGLTTLIPVILMRNAHLGPAGTPNLPLFLSALPSESQFYLPIFLVTVISFFIDKLLPCLLKHLLGKLLSQVLDLRLYKIPPLVS